MKCYYCAGEGGWIHPDGLSAESCNKCNGTGIEITSPSIKKGNNLLHRLRKFFSKIFKLNLAS